MQKDVQINYKRIPLTISLALPLLISIVNPVAALATPGADDNYQTIQAVNIGASNYYGVNCADTDISSSWEDYILDSNTWYDPNDISNPNSWNYKAKQSFENALSNGRWGVSQRVEYGGNGYSRTVIIFWTEDRSLALNWSDDSIVATTSSSTTNLHTLQIGCSAVALGYGGSAPIAWLYDNSSNVAISNDQTFNPSPSSYAQDNGIANLFVYTDHPNYPVGYTGPDLIPGTYISGNVQCANQNNLISHVIIDADSSLDGSAILTDDGMGGKDYIYYLRDDSAYHLVVICDGDLFFSPTVNSNLYSSKNWACVKISGEVPSCAAS